MKQTNTQNNMEKWTQYEIYDTIKKLFDGYRNKKIITKYKRNLSLNKYNRSIRTNYFTIYPKKYHNTHIEYIYKRYQKYIRKMEDLLYVEYMENVYKKYYNQLRFERDTYNSLEKERELFSEHDKSALIGLSLLFENPMSYTFLIPKIKDIKRMYKDFRVTNKYFVNMKRLEKTFTIPNSLRMSDPRIAQVVRKSLIHKIKKPTTNNITLNKDSIKGPPNIFKECLRIYHTSIYIKRTLNKCNHIKDKIKSNITKYIRKFYYDIKWNFVFINKIYRDIPGLLRKSLRYTYNTYYKISLLSIDSLNNKKNTFEILNELQMRTLFVYSLTRYHEITYIKKSTEQIISKYKEINIQSELQRIKKQLFIRIMLIVIRENIRNIIKNRIVNYYMPYVNIMSKQYLRSGYYADISDLIQEGTIGVIEAAERYQLGRGVRFLTYAYWWMHRYMIKIAIRKKRVFKLNKKTNVKKKLFLRINTLYENLRKKINDELEVKVELQKLKNNIPNSNNYGIVKHIQLKDILQHKDFVIYALHKGIYPYKEHTIEQIATILEVPEYMIQTCLKRANKNINIISI